MTLSACRKELESLVPAGERVGGDGTFALVANRRYYYVHQTDPADYLPLRRERLQPARPYHHSGPPVIVKGADDGVRGARYRAPRKGAYALREGTEHRADPRKEFPPLAPPVAECAIGDSGQESRRWSSEGSARVGAAPRIVDGLRSSGQHSRFRPEVNTDGITVLIPAAGAVPEVLALANVGCPAMIPVAGRPLIYWTLSYLCSLGLRRFKVAVSGAGCSSRTSSPASSAADATSSSWCPPPGGPADTLGALLERVETPAALVVLGDTHFTFADPAVLGSDRPFVLIGPVEESERWCIARLDEQGRVVQLRRQGARPVRPPGRADRRLLLPRRGRRLLVATPQGVGPGGAPSAVRRAVEGLGQLGGAAAGGPPSRRVARLRQPRPPGRVAPRPAPEAGLQRARDRPHCSARSSSAAATSRSSSTRSTTCACCRPTWPCSSRACSTARRTGTTPGSRWSTTAIRRLAEVFVFENVDPGIWGRVFVALARDPDALLHAARPPARRRAACTRCTCDKTRDRLGDSRARPSCWQLVRHEGPVTVNGRVAARTWPVMAPDRGRCGASGRGASTAAVIHGDLCLSNILYDLRSRASANSSIRAAASAASGITGDPRTTWPSSITRSTASTTSSSTTCSRCRWRGPNPAGDPGPVPPRRDPRAFREGLLRGLRPRRDPAADRLAVRQHARPALRPAAPPGGDVRPGARYSRRPLRHGLNPGVRRPARHQPCVSVLTWTASICGLRGRGRATPRWSPCPARSRSCALSAAPATT